MTELKEIKTKKNENTDGVYIESVGRRKTSTARVRFYNKADLSVKGADEGIIINGKKLNEYFATEELRIIAEEPLKKSRIGKYKITAMLTGGGIHSQAEALRHGISRALIEFNADLRKGLKEEGFLGRDSRMKERRKFGLKKARKAPQWSKR